MSDLFASSTPFVCATIVDVTGSVPTDAGAKMLVTADGAYYGTVGGGKVEKRIIDEACSMIRNAQHSSSSSSSSSSSPEDAVASDKPNARFFDWS
ncbi:MAG: XdhC family protein, partial [Leptolyngbya sp.]|nr:XdhC family protein [Candidatus Melainabacteria bacterium]